MEKAFGEAMAKSATGEKKLPKSLYQTLINSVWCARAPVPHRPLPRVVLHSWCALCWILSLILCVCARFVDVTGTVVRTTKRVW